MATLPLPPPLPLPPVQIYAPHGYFVHSPTYLSPTNNMSPITGFVTSPHFNATGPTTLSPQSNGTVGTDREPRENAANGMLEKNAGAKKEIPFEKFVSLYVGDLSNVVKDENLFEFFRGAGLNIVTVKVCRDINTGNSLRYGYANFLNHEDAVLAIEKLNNTVLYGRQIRLMWSTRNSEALKNGIGNLHVKNLNLAADNARLYEIFAKVGSVLSVKVMRNNDGSSRGYGFVQFASKELADAAIEALDGNVVDGKKVTVAHYIKKSERKGNDPDSFNNVFVKNIDEEIDEVLIRLKFSKFGNITSTKYEKDENGNPKGFCFVCFEKSDNAKMAVQEMNGLQLGNKTLYVGRAMKKAERAQFLQSQKEKKAKERQMKFQGSNLFVKNLSEKIDDAILREYFSQCGIITSAKVMRNSRGVSKGFGFVCYSSPQEAQKAIATLHHQFFYGIPLYVAPFERKEDRKARLERYFKNVHVLNGSNARTSSAFIPVMYQPSMYYNPTRVNVVPQVQYNQSLMAAQPYNVRTIVPASASSSVHQQAPNTRPKRFYNRSQNNNRSSPRNYRYRNSASYQPNPKKLVLKYVPVSRFDAEDNKPSTSSAMETEVSAVHTIAVVAQPEVSLKSQETANPNCISAQLADN